MAKSPGKGSKKAGTSAADKVEIKEMKDLRNDHENHYLIEFSKDGLIKHMDQLLIDEKPDIMDEDGPWSNKYDESNFKYWSKFAKSLPNGELYGYRWVEVIYPKAYDIDKLNNYLHNF